MLSNEYFLALELDWVIETVILFGNDDAVLTVLFLSCAMKKGITWTFSLQVMLDRLLGVSLQHELILICLRVGKAAIVFVTPSFVISRL